MKTTTRRHRTARKLVLPLIAIGLMTTMMYLESVNRGSRTAESRTQAPARASFDLHR